MESKPVFLWNNMLDSAVVDDPEFTGTGREWELSRPARNILQRWPSKRAETNHTSFVIVASQNDRYDFNDGGGNRTASFTPARYRNGKKLAAHVTAQVNAAIVTGAHDYLCSYNTTTHKFTENRSTGVLSLLLKSGANRGRSLGKTLGHDCSADKTGSLTYIADFVRTSTWGRFEVDTLALRVSGTTINLVNGVYNIYTLCQMLLDVIDTAKTWGVDVEWREGVKWFAFMRNGGAANWEFSSGLFSAADMLGYLTQGADIGTTDLQYTDTALAPAVPDIRIHWGKLGIVPYGFSEGISFTLPEDVTPTAMMLAGNNLTENASVALFQRIGSAWIVVENLENGLGAPQEISQVAALFEWAATPTDDQFMIGVTDPTNPAGFISLGVFILGIEFQLERGLTIDTAQFFSEDYSSVSQADYGQVSINVKAPDKGLTFLASDAPSIDRVNLEALQDALSIGPGFYININPNDTTNIALYVRLVQRIAFTDKTVTDPDFPDEFQFYDYNITVIGCK